jgi:hypothetical protein
MTTFAELLTRALETFRPPESFEEWRDAVDRSYADDAALILRAIAADPETIPVLAAALEQAESGDASTYEHFAAGLLTALLIEETA